jgi:hypothetical protein
MKTYDSAGSVELADAQQLLARLRSVRTANRATFWLSREKWPVLVVNINGELAYLHYLPADRHAGYQPVPDSVWKGDEQITFGGDGVQEAFKMGRAWCVSVDLAYSAAKEFFDTNALPTAIQWQEL